MSLDDFRGFAYQLQKASSEYEREKIIKDYRDAFLNEQKPDIIEEVVEDIKSGIAIEADEIKEAILAEHEDEWRDEIEDELRNKYAEEKIAWVEVRNKVLRQTLNTTIQSLQNLSEILSKSNSIGSSGDLLTPMQREMLIAALRTMIVELEAPCVDRGRVANLLGWVKGVAKKSAEDKVRSGLSGSIDEASQALGKLLKEINGSETTGIF